MSKPGDRITAPFTPDQIRSLNEYQASGVMHPFTCAYCREPLVADERGWACSIGCDYQQDWAHAWMADYSWRRWADVGVFKAAKDTHLPQPPTQ